MTNVLFLCSQNKLRSPTAEQLFASYPGITCLSAGLNHDAVQPLTPELLKWAELTFVMEKAQRTRLSQRFRVHLHGQRVDVRPAGPQCAVQGAKFGLDSGVMFGALTFIASHTRQPPNSVLPNGSAPMVVPPVSCLP